MPGMPGMGMGMAPAAPAYGLPAGAAMDLHPPPYAAAAAAGAASKQAMPPYGALPQQQMHQPYGAMPGSYYGMAPEKGPPMNPYGAAPQQLATQGQAYGGGLPQQQQQQMQQQQLAAYQQWMAAAQQQQMLQQQQQQQQQMAAYGMQQRMMQGQQPQQQPAEPKRKFNVAAQSLRPDVKGWKYRPNAMRFKKFRETLGEHPDDMSLFKDTEYIPQLGSKSYRLSTIFHDRAFKKQDGLAMVLVCLVALATAIVGTMVGDASALKSTLVGNGVCTLLFLAFALFGLVRASTWAGAERKAKFWIFLTAAVNALCTLLTVIWIFQPDVTSGPAAAWVWIGAILIVLQMGLMVFAMTRIIAFSGGTKKAPAAAAKGANGE